MMKIFLLMLLFACGIHCRTTPIFSQKEKIRSFQNVTKNITSQARNSTLNGYKFLTVPHREAFDCVDVLEMGYNTSGIYQVWPMSTPTSRVIEGISIYVYCDMDTDGGGWTVIQRRGDFKRNKDYFYRNWETYKRGFGNMEEDFWLGNDKIFALTNQKIYTVRFDLQDVNNDTRYAVYDEFWIDDEKHNYALHIDYYIGDAGDAMTKHNNNPFATFDHENPGKCAAKYKGGWWYYCSHLANLNGLYYKGKNGNSDMNGLSWSPWKGGLESLEWTEIKIRPKHFKTIFP